MLEVIDPGLHGTIQDLGRPGAAHLGVRRAGAADVLALTAANLLAGNEPGAPALELTLLGGRFAVRAECLVGLAGADMAAHVPEEDRRLAPGRSHRLAAGTTLVLGPAQDGARAYLALGGGIAAEYALGSASTDPIAGFGGMHGRAIEAGDVLATSRVGAGPERAWPATAPSSGISHGESRIRVVDGPHLDDLESTLERLTGQSWVVSVRSDRVGVRLEGRVHARAAHPELISLPMMPGAIQLPPGGQPIILLPDAPTVGGYPVPAVVAEVDRPLTGQLRPGDSVGFERIEMATARQRSIVAAARISTVAAALT